MRSAGRLDTDRALRAMKPQEFWEHLAADVLDQEDALRAMRPRKPPRPSPEELRRKIDRIFDEREAHNG